MTKTNNYLTKDEERLLILRAQRGNNKCAEILINNNDDLIFSIARYYIKYFKTGVDFKELIQDGRIGVMYAIKNFDFEKNCRLSTYAFQCIKRFILRDITQNLNTLKKPKYFTELSIKYTKLERLYNEIGIILTNTLAAQLLETTIENIKLIKFSSYPMLSISTEMIIDDEIMELSDIIADCNNLDEDDLLNKIDIDLTMKELNFDLLTPKQKMAIYLYFGFDIGRQRTIHEVSIIMNCSEENVRQRVKAGLERLRLNYNHKQMRKKRGLL